MIFFDCFLPAVNSTCISTVHVNWLIDYPTTSTLPPVHPAIQNKTIKEQSLCFIFSFFLDCVCVCVLTVCERKIVKRRQPRHDAVQTDVFSLLGRTTNDMAKSTERLRCHPGLVGWLFIFFCFCFLYSGGQGEVGERAVLARTPTSHQFTRWTSLGRIRWRWQLWRRGGRAARWCWFLGRGRWSLMSRGPSGQPFSF